MQVTLFVSSLIAILAIAVYFVHRAYLDRKIYDDARESMDLIVEHLDGIDMVMGNISRALSEDTLDSVPDSDAQDYIDAGFVEDEDHED